MNTSNLFTDIKGQLIARVMCGVSTSLRFPGQLNGSVALTVPTYTELLRL